MSDLNPKQEIKRTRKFLGNVPSGSNRVTNFERKEFKAYLRGQKVFRFGEDAITGYPKFFKVRQSFS